MLCCSQAATMTLLSIPPANFMREYLRHRANHCLPGATNMFSSKTSVKRRKIHMQIIFWRYWRFHCHSMHCPVKAHPNTYYLNVIEFSELAFHIYASICSYVLLEVMRNLIAGIIRKHILNAFNRCLPRELMQVPPVFFSDIVSERRRTATPNLA